MNHRRGAVLFEFIRIGAYVKVIAVDERTGTEVSMVGDPSRSSDYLKEGRPAKTRTRYGPQRTEAKRFGLRGNGLFLLRDTDDIRLEQRVDFIIAVADFPENFTGVCSPNRGGKR